MLPTRAPPTKAAAMIASTGGKATPPIIIAPALPNRGPATRASPP
ncbi:unnamed protein product, partial [Rotaria sordida]